MRTTKREKFIKKYMIGEPEQPKKLRLTAEVVFSNESLSKSNFYGCVLNEVYFMRRRVEKQFDDMVKEIESVGRFS